METQFEKETKFVEQLRDGILIDVEQGTVAMAVKLAEIRRAFHRHNKDTTYAETLAYPEALQDQKNLAGDAKGLVGELIVRQLLVSKNIVHTAAPIVDYVACNAPDFTFTKYGIAIDVKTACTVSSLSPRSLGGNFGNDKFVAIDCKKHAAWRKKYSEFAGYFIVNVLMKNDEAVQAIVQFVDHYKVETAQRKPGAMGKEYYAVATLHNFTAGTRVGDQLQYVAKSLSLRSRYGNDTQRRAHSEYVAKLRAKLHNKEYSEDDCMFLNDIFLKNIGTLSSKWLDSDKCDPLAILRM